MAFLPQQTDSQSVISWNPDIFWHGVQFFLKKMEETAQSEVRRSVKHVYIQLETQLMKVTD